MGLPLIEVPVSRFTSPGASECYPCCAADSFIREPLLPRAPGNATESTLPTVSEAVFSSTSVLTRCQVLLRHEANAEEVANQHQQLGSDALRADLVERQVTDAVASATGALPTLAMSL